jgi:hypothetical protein
MSPSFGGALPLLLLAEVQMAFRDFDEVYRSLDRAEALAPGFDWIVLNRALVLERDDRATEARATLEALLERRPHYRPALQMLAGVLNGLGDRLDLAADALYGTHSYGRMVQLEELAAVEAKHLRSWLLADRNPANATLIVVGDFTGVDALGLVRGWFDGWEGRPEYRPQPLPPPQAPAAGEPSETVLLHHRPGVTQTQLTFACRLPNADLRAVAVNETVATILGSNVYTQVRHEAGAAYSVEGGATLLRGGASHLMFTLMADDARLRKVIAVVRGHLQRLHTEGFDPGALSQVKWHRAMRDALAFRTATELNLRLADGVRLGFGVDYVCQLPTLAAGVTREELASAFAVCRSRTVLSLVGDEARIRAALTPRRGHGARDRHGGGVGSGGERLSPRHVLGRVHVQERAQLGIRAAQLVLEEPAGPELLHDRRGLEPPGGERRGDGRGTRTAVAGTQRLGPRTTRRAEARHHRIGPRGYVAQQVEERWREERQVARDAHHGVLVRRERRQRRVQAGERPASGPAAIGHDPQPQALPRRRIVGHEHDPREGLTERLELPIDDAPPADLDEALGPPAEPGGRAARDDRGDGACRGRSSGRRAGHAACRSGLRHSTFCIQVASLDRAIWYSPVPVIAGSTSLRSMGSKPSFCPKYPCAPSVTRYRRTTPSMRALVSAVSTSM